MFDNWNEFADSEFEINGKIYRNIQAQVQENMDDIAELKAEGLPTAEITAKLKEIDQEIASLNAADGEITGQIGDLTENKVSKDGDSMSGSLVNTGAQQGSIPTDSCEFSKYGLRSTGRNLVFTTKETITVQRAIADARGRTIILKGIRADNDPTSAVCLSQLNIRLAPSVGELIPASGCQIKYVVMAGYISQFQCYGTCNETMSMSDVEVDLRELFVLWVEKAIEQQADFVEWTDPKGHVAITIDVSTPDLVTFYLNGAAQDITRPFPQFTTV